MHFFCAQREVFPTNPVVKGEESEGERAMTDTELIAGLCSRDPDALGALVDAYATPVYQLIHRILAGAGSEQDVEECASDTFHASWERSGQYDSGRAPLRTWLLTLAKYQALERRRKLGRPAPEPLEAEQWSALGPTPEEALASADERAALQAALDRLPPTEKELVYRRYFIGERVEDLARDLGLTRQAADNRLWRARKALRAILTPHLKEVAGDEA